MAIGRAGLAAFLCIVVSTGPSWADADELVARKPVSGSTKAVAVVAFDDMRWTFIPNPNGHGFLIQCHHGDKKTESVFTFDTKGAVVDVVARGHDYGNDTIAIGLGVSLETDAPAKREYRMLWGQGAPERLKRSDGWCWSKPLLEVPAGDRPYGMSVWISHGDSFLLPLKRLTRDRDRLPNEESLGDTVEVHGFLYNCSGGGGCQLPDDVGFLVRFHEVLRAEKQKPVQEQVDPMDVDSSN